MTITKDRWTVGTTSTAVTATTLLAGSSILYASYYYYNKNYRQSDPSCREEKAPQESKNLVNKLDETLELKQEEQEPLSVKPFVVKEIQMYENAANGRTSVQSKQEGMTTTTPQHRILARGTITIVHGSVTGTCAKQAQTLFQELSASNTKYGTTGSTIQLGAIDDFDWWDEFSNDEGELDQNNSAAAAALLIVFLPTYTAGTWPPTATSLQTALEDLKHDWRMTKFPLQGKLRVAVFGMGSSEYDDADISNNTTATKTTDQTMGRPARQAVRHFQQLGAKCLVRLRVGDDAVAHDAEETLAAWKQELLYKLKAPPKQQQQKQRQQQSRIQKSVNTLKAVKEEGNGCCSSTNDQKESTGCCQSEEKSDCCQEHHGTELVNEKDTVEEGVAADDYDQDDDDDEKNDDYDDEDEEEEEEEDDNNKGEPAVMDLEDIGDAMNASSISTKSTAPREMVTPRQAQALKKEGYRLIGTHSAVKLCRWTKHQLRGRGGCYKHTFYGITSYQCMEATPSLACANKCVFCWRHHKNPVGKEWRWKTDDPYFIVDEAVQEHVRMIKETKGIPGVQMDRWKEAHTVRHCALSLVGEPIMYPRINDLLSELHRRHISTFLVTNGQHPQAIDSLIPITQLYVSVDAPTQESLIAIDRPLFQDAWERLKQSLVAVRQKGQRTVARLTVVKGWNSDEVAGYAQLIALGHVSLVEVKGVTFCGKSDASNLNMTNSPWHHEVVELTTTLKQELAKLREIDTSLPEYDLACEHKHSCSVLLARVDQFAVDIDVDDPALATQTESRQRQWRTWIDYVKFQELAARSAQDPAFTFTVQDYTAPTPSWALFGATEEGFDPTDTRHRKAKKYPMYTAFDNRGIPTHDHNNVPLSAVERKRLSQMMERRMEEMGNGSVVTELRGGEKEIHDASLMFRGLVVAK